MGICSSSANLKRLVRCSKCRRNPMKKRLPRNGAIPTTMMAASNDKQQEIEHQAEEAFYAVADDPAFISRREFERSLGHAIGPALWRHLQGDDEKEMDLDQFKKHAKTVLQMQPNQFAQLGMCSRELLHACLISCDFALLNSSNKSFHDCEFLRKLADQMGQEPEHIIAWKDRNCPRLFQSIQEHILHFFLGIPKSVVEESKLEESTLLDQVEMFFLKHNLPRKEFFERSATEEVEAEQHSDRSEEEKQSSSWTKLYDSGAQGLGPENFEQNVFPFDGSTVAIFQMESGQTFALAVDQQWKNDRRPFGGPYTVLLRFQPDFQRFEAEPPALHCDLRSDTVFSNCIFFNGGTVLAVNADFANVKAVEVWGCARRTRMAEVVEMPRMGEEEQKIVEKRRTRGMDAGTKPKGQSAQQAWAENPDKQLLEMAGFTFSDKRQRGQKK